MKEFEELVEHTIRHYEHGKERSCTSCQSFEILKLDDRLEFMCTNHAINVKPYYTCDGNVRAEYEDVVAKAYYLEEHYHLEEE